MDTNWKEIEENDAICLLVRDTNEEIRLIKQKLDILTSAIRNLQDNPVTIVLEVKR